MGACRVGTVTKVAGGERARGIPGGCCNLEDNGVASWLKDDGVEGEGGKKSAAAWLLAQVA
jgi:hypothetical protein